MVNNNIRYADDTAKPIKNYINNDKKLVLYSQKYGLTLKEKKNKLMKISKKNTR